MLRVMYSGDGGEVGEDDGDWEGNSGVGG